MDIHFHIWYKSPFIFLLPWPLAYINLLIHMSLILMGQSRMDNPEKLASLGTQNLGQRQTKQKNTTQKTKKMSNTDPTKNQG